MFALAITFSFLACREKSVSEVTRDFRSGEYVQAVEIPGYRIDIRFISRVLALLDRAGLDSQMVCNQRLLDSLEERNGISGPMFLMSITPLAESNRLGDNDLIYGSASGYSDYKQAIQEYHFGLMKKIWIEADGKKYPLVNYQMTNSFGMTSGRDFVMVFSDELFSGKQKIRSFTLVLDNVTPGSMRNKVEWRLPKRIYAPTI